MSDSVFSLHRNMTKVNKLEQKYLRPLEMSLLNSSEAFRIWAVELFIFAYLVELDEKFCLLQNKNDHYRVYKSRHWTLSSAIES